MCKKEGKNSIYLTKSLRGLNEVIHAKGLAQHLEHHLKSQKYYLLLSLGIQGRSPRLLLFPQALGEGDSADYSKRKQLPSCMWGVNVCVTVFHFLLEPFPL